MPADYCYTHCRRCYRHCHYALLCQPAKWSGDIDDMATMYELELTSILDHLIPFREVTRRARPSVPWFDKDCLEAKRLTLRLERAYWAT